VQPLFTVKIGTMQDRFGVELFIRWRLLLAGECEKGKQLTWRPDSSKPGRIRLVQ
jgi:hypothetical protein